MLSPKSTNDISSVIMPSRDQDINSCCTGVSIRSNISTHDKNDGMSSREKESNPFANTYSNEHLNTAQSKTEDSHILDSPHARKNYVAQTHPEDPMFNVDTQARSITPIDVNTLINSNIRSDSSAISNSNPHLQAQQYCLRWNNFQTNLTRTFSELFLTQSFVDVTLACSKSKSLKAHKLVLSACSPYFYELFLKNTCDHVLIIINDIEFNELTKIIEFMYKGEINLLQEEIEPLLKVAQLLKVRGLADLDRDESCNDTYEDNNEFKNEYENKKFLGRVSKNNKFVGRWPKKHDELLERASMKERSQTPDKDFDSDKDDKFAKEKIIIDKLAEDKFGEKYSDMCNIEKNQMDNDKSCGDNVIPSKRKRISCDFNKTSLNLSKMKNEKLINMNKLNNDEISSKLIINNDLNVSEDLINCMNSPPLIRALINNSPPLIMDTSPPLIGGGILLGNERIPGSLLGNDGLGGNADDLEIKPGIAEMIREEERAKMLENSQAWLGASTSSIADSYQYQLQSLWQKCWNTNQQSLLHNLRFRERGPLKSWRPETMAEAIFSVLKQGLSLSQAARKYDIPYPTFVLYANRVHNMLGPSADGGSDLRPKGRGRPQRILLGVWPDEHIRGVIRTVVFRDSANSTERSYPTNNDRYLINERISTMNEGPQPPPPPQVKEDNVFTGYKNNSLPSSFKEEPPFKENSPCYKDVIGYKENMSRYPGVNEMMLGAQTRGLNPSLYDGLLTYANDSKMNMAAVAAISQGLRQQMCSMVAMAQQQQHMSDSPIQHPNLLMRPGMCTPESPSAQNLPMTPTEIEDSPSPTAHDLSSVPVSFKRYDGPSPAVASMTSGNLPVRDEQFPEGLSDMMQAQASSSLSNVEPLDLKDTKSNKLDP